MIGDRIKSFRVAHGMTQAELANKVGVKPTVVSSWEIGRTEPNLGQTGALARVFDVSIDELVADRDQWLEEITVPAEEYSPEPNSTQRLLKYALLVSQMSENKQLEVFNYIDYISKKD